MAINKIEMQDSNGNALYPHTTGDLVNYDTTKTVNQKIDEAISNLTSLKAGLVTSVNNKTGSSLTSDSTLADITSKINQIVTLSSGTADANATTGQILSGSTAYVKGNKITGSMTNNGTVTSNLNCGASYTIPAGYHNGSGQVTANSLASQTQATAVAGDMISGKTAYVNGSKIIGNITSKTATTYTPSTSNQIIPAGNYLSGDQIIKGDANLVGGNIISGKTIFGVAGTATVQSMGGCEVRDYLIGPGESLSVILEKCPLAAVYARNSSSNGAVNFNNPNQYQDVSWWETTSEYFYRLHTGNMSYNSSVYFFRDRLNLQINANSLIYQGVGVFF